MTVKRCPHCNASMQEYKRNFSAGLAQCVRKIAEAGGYDVDVAELRLTNNQYANFQRLRFWGLIEKVMHGDDHGKGGHWNLTPLGWDFVRGDTGIRQYAITYRGEVQSYEGDFLMIYDVADGWWYKPRVVSESRPHMGTTA